jgi:hypothetical protein
VYHYTSTNVTVHLHIKISNIFGVLPANQQCQPRDGVCQEILRPLYNFVFTVHLVREDHHVPQQPSALLFQLYSTRAT